MANRSNYAYATQSTSGSGNLLQQPEASASPSPAPVNMAGKVAEVFLTAGHAFQKLGDLTLQLHAVNDTDENKWSEREVDRLNTALTRFAQDLEQISESVQARTTKHIRTDIKRRHMFGDESQPAAPAAKRIYTTPPSGPQPTSTQGERIVVTQGSKPVTQRPAGSQQYVRYA